MADSFAPIARVPTTVSAVEIVLRVVDGTPKVYDGRYSFDVLDQDGAILDVRAGDLSPHLTQTQINSVVASLNAMLTKAQGAIG